MMDEIRRKRREIAMFTAKAAIALSSVLGKVLDWVIIHALFNLGLNQDTTPVYICCQ